MIAHPPERDAGAASGTFARTVLDIAAEVEAAELSLKREILAAAGSGDCARVMDIVARWLDTPPAEVLASMRLAPCGGPEVTQGEHPGAGGGSTE